MLDLFIVMVTELKSRLCDSFESFVLYKELWIALRSIINHKFFVTLASAIKHNRIMQARCTHGVKVSIQVWRTSCAFRCCLAYDKCIPQGHPSYVHVCRLPH